MACRRWVRALLTALAITASLAGARADEPAKAPADSARPEVGKPIQAAKELIQAKKYKDALAKLHEAEAVPNLNPYEKFILDLMRGSAAQGAGENDTAISSFESVVASGRLQGADQQRLEAAIAQLYYQAKDYAKAITWANRYEKEGGTDPAIHQTLVQAEYLGGDYAAAARELKAEIDADEKAGRTPAEDRLTFLISCYLKTNDNAGYMAVLEKLVAYYPKKQYWADLIYRMQKRVADRLTLDLYRIQLATGNLSKPTEYMEMAELALQAGFPSEAKKVVDQAFAGGIFGKGAEAERQNRLRDLAGKEVAKDTASIAKGDADAGSAKDGDGLVAIGYNLVLNGQADRGLSLMEQGLHKTPLKRPDDAKLHLGIAYIQAGQKAKAVQVLETVQGKDGTAELARMWLLHVGKAT
jgi:outer membrane protein assembly factor BamD (BamD/ComL family)